MNAPHPAPPPEPVTLAGRYCRLEPLAPHHAADLFAAIGGEGVEARHRYLFELPPADLAALEAWLERAMAGTEMMFFAVIDAATGHCGGRQAIMRVRPEHGSAEIGAILWGRGVARTRIATEAVYLTAMHLFETLGYRRFEWKCNARNEKSRAAAIRFGFAFEGIFRQDMIVKGENRDTAWFSILDSEWPGLKAAFEQWLDPANFDAEGRQKTPLATPRP
jgi:RimJ/RimL family protein N-acetyltransferase